MKDIQQVIQFIISREEKIIQSISQKSVEDYKYIQREFQRENITRNDEFQSRFKSFYRMNPAHLSNEFYSRFFEILESNRSSEIVDLEGIVRDLYKCKRKKGDNSIQFSFVTKLAHTIKPDVYPIYDSKVVKLFGLGKHYYEYDTDRKIQKYLKKYQIIQDTYDYILNNGVLNSTMRLFDKKFPNSNISKLKKLDFISWSAGKLK